MTWFRVDDTLPNHPKLDGLRAERLAAVIGVWTLSGVDCAARGLDHVSRARLERLFGVLSRQVLLAVDELVARGFWEPVDGAEAWRFHDWADYQLTPDEVDERRRAAAKRQRDRRQRMRDGHAPVTRDTPGDVGVTHAAVTPPSRRDPLRAPARVPDPVPSRPDPREREAPAAPPRALAPDAARLAEQLGRHVAFADLDRDRLAEQLDGERIAKGTPLSWLESAIGECARDIQAGAHGESPPRAARAKLVLSYARRAKAPEAGAGSSDPSALRARPSTKLEPLTGSPAPPEVAAQLLAIGKRSR